MTNNKPFGWIWLEFDGAFVTIDGLKCKIRAIERFGKVWADAEPVNRHSKTYTDLKKRLGDDWSTDLNSLNDENFVAILNQLPGAVEMYLAG